MADEERLGYGIAIGLSWASEEGLEKKRM